MEIMAYIYIYIYREHSKLYALSETLCTIVYSSECIHKDVWLLPGRCGTWHGWSQCTYSLLMAGLPGEFWTLEMNERHQGESKIKESVEKVRVAYRYRYLWKRCLIVYVLHWNNIIAWLLNVLELLNIVAAMVPANTKGISFFRGSAECQHKITIINTQYSVVYVWIPHLLEAVKRRTLCA